MILAGLLLAVAACGGTETGSGAAAAVSTARVRELVGQYGQGGDVKDVALEELYEMGAAARPALLEMIRDPKTSEYDLESLTFIVSLDHCTPEMFDALRTRFRAARDAQWRRMQLGLVDALQKQGGCLPAD